MFNRLYKLTIVFPLLIVACAHTPSDEPADPLVPVNRVVFSFNLKADQYVIRPVAKGYVAVVPEIARSGVSNFFSNLFYPIVVINDSLQGKFHQSVADLGRFLVNSTVGLVGILDPATKIGLERHSEDFGQTYGVCGIGSGWYLMVPLLGPSTNRDFVGKIVGVYASPTTYMPNDISLPFYLLDAVDTRAGLLDTDGLLDQQFDKYVFVRTSYLQYREGQVYDGNPPREDQDINQEESTKIN